MSGTGPQQTLLPIFQDNTGGLRIPTPPTVEPTMLSHICRILQSRLSLPKEIRSNADYGQYFHFNAFVDILQKGQWTME